LASCFRRLASLLHLLQLFLRHFRHGCCCCC
jgi:hypothetical protein